MRNEKSVKNLLIEPAGLSTNIQEKLQIITRLNKLWGEFIGPQLKPHCRVANWRDNCLVIEIESSAWVTHLRYQIPELTKRLKKHEELQDLRAIEWFISPITLSLTNKPPRRKVNPLSEKNAQLLENIAENIKNKPLKKALKKLAKNIEK